MKKIVCLLLAASLLLALAACKPSDLPPASENPTEESTDDNDRTSDPTETPDPSETETPDPSDEPDPTQEPTISKPSAITELSSDPYSFQLQVNDTIFAFPMTVADFTALGWVCNDDDTAMLDSYYRDGTVEFSFGDLKCYATVVNFDISALPMKNCYVGGVNVDDYLARNSTAKVLAPGGLELRVSAEEDILAAYGTPSRENRMDSGTVVLEYSLGSYQSVEFWIDGETKTISEISVENLTKPADFVESAISDEVPEIVGRYQAPAALSDDLGDWTAKLGGVLYTLPAPVSVFESNGWKIVEAESEMNVAGRDSGWVVLMLDNQKMKLLVTNYSPGATSIRNCFATSIKSGRYDSKIDLEIGKGIYFGMPQAEFEAIIAGIEHTVDESSSFIYYEISPTGSRVDGYTITISKEDSVVHAVEVEFSPRYADFTK